MRFICIAAVILALAGCAGQPLKFPGQRAVELSATPFFPQTIHECGPAALATVLVDAGVAVTPEDLTKKVYLPARQGSLQLELVAATRGYDRLAYEIEPQLEALLAQVAAGKPVLVLQNLALKHYPAWHYAVVIGFDADRRTLILRSGTTKRLEIPVRKFARSWASAESWGVVVLRPDELPARADPARYLQAAAGVEVAGRNAAALQAYRTALTRWPDDATALLGVGNVHYRQRDLAAAAQAYRTLVDKHPRNAVAHNNLAQVLLEQGDAPAALEEVRKARAVLEDQRFAAELADTEAQIRKALSR